MSILQVKAEDMQLHTILAYIDAQLENAGCPKRTGMQIAIAAEEIFVNIAHYAYDGKKGDVIVRINMTSDREGISITFEDNGTPYNPLTREDPDIDLCAEQRKIGGLGIYIVKKSMDEILYEYRDGKNQLTIRKYWDKSARETY